MSFLNRFWRVPALALAVALPLAVACADDEGAVLEQDTEDTGSISGTVTNSETGEPIVGALVGTSPATTTSLTDASGNFTISDVATGSYAVTASKEGFASNSTTVSVTEDATATANLQLDPAVGETTGDLNVKVVRRNGDPVEGATVEVIDSEGAAVVDPVETNAEGFALFSDLDPQSVTVRATKDISGFPFRASAGTNIEAGEVAFVELTLRRDHQQSTFPNIDGESVELGPGSDIEFVPAPGGDSNPEVDCNIIRTQHMFIAEVTNEEGTPVSGVKVQWDLNIAESGTVTIECNDFLADLLGQEAGCGVTTVPGNTGSVVDSDDPDLDPGTARSFNVTTRKAVTFTNDNDQDVSFNGETVTVGAGQTWIVITSPVEGQTDVIAATPDIPATADCANNDPGACDKEFAIKRWVNWDIRVAELDWPAAEAGVRDEDNPGQTDDDCAPNGGVTPAQEVGDNPACDPHDDPNADFNFVEDGGTITNVLARVETRCDLSDFDGDGDTHGEGDFDGQPEDGACELTQNRVLFISEVERLRPDSPFNLADGFMVWQIVDDDDPDADFWGEGADNGASQLSAEGSGFATGVGNVEVNSTSDDQYWINTRGLPPTNRNVAAGEFDANNQLFDGGAGFFFLGPEDDFIGWVVVETRLDPSTYYCVDVDGDGQCRPGAGPDSFSTAYQRLLEGNVDDTNTFRVRFFDDFGEVCGELTFDKRWVQSRLEIIKNHPDATRRTVHEDNGGPEITGLSNTPRPVKTHTVEVGQTFSYTVTVINDGEETAENVRITDTLPRFSYQFCNPAEPGEAECDNFLMRNGGQAFVYVTDRPAFDPAAVVYGVDDDNDATGDTIDRCIFGEDPGSPYVPPAVCGVPADLGSVAAARTAAESASADGDQIVWIQWFDATVLARTDVGGGIESEDSVEITLAANASLYDDECDPENPSSVGGADCDLDNNTLTDHNNIPGTWCNIATVTDGPLNARTDDLPESFDADTLCHEVLEALIEIRKTAFDAVVQGGTRDSFEIALANPGSAPLQDVVITDTLDPGLGPITVDDVHLQSGFEGASVNVITHSDGEDRIVEVAIGDFDPTGGAFVPIFHLVFDAPFEEGTFCNRVTVEGVTGAGETARDQDISCIQVNVSIELDISNSDGFVDEGGAFQSDKEEFQVGESGDDFVFEVQIINQSANVTATGLVVEDVVAPKADRFECTTVRFVSQGSIVGGDCSPDGFTWNIGDLGPGESAVVRFSAEAQSAGDDVNRVILTADQLTGDTVDEEPTTIVQ